MGLSSARRVGEARAPCHSTGPGAGHEHGVAAGWRQGCAVRGNAAVDGARSASCRFATTALSRPLAENVHARPPGFCTGCPERPIFSAMKLLERELGPHHVSADIGCHLFSILPPFGIGNTTMGYGLGTAGAVGTNVPGGKRAISMMGDGGFWHNGLTSGIANSVFNRSDNLTIVVDNNYTSATGGQDILVVDRRQRARAAPGTRSSARYAASASSG